MIIYPEAGNVLPLCLFAYMTEYLDKPVLKHLQLICCLQGMHSPNLSILLTVAKRTVYFHAKRQRKPSPQRKSFVPLCVSNSFTRRAQRSGDIEKTLLRSLLPCARRVKSLKPHEVLPSVFLAHFAGISLCMVEFVTKMQTSVIFHAPDVILT